MTTQMAMDNKGHIEDMSGNKTNAAPHGKVWRCKTCKEFSKWKDTVSTPDLSHEHELELVSLQVIMDGK